MNFTFTLFLSAFLLIATLSLAQTGERKIYTAGVTNGYTGTLTKRDRDEITFQAKNKIDNFKNLLDLLSTADILESERNSAIQNSYLPNQDQLFYNDAIVIEDDIDPKHIDADHTAYIKVDRYLHDLDLFYTKSSESTIKISKIITSPVLEGKEYAYIKVFFTTTFTGKHKQSDVAYQPVQRVAELRADRVNKKWQTLIIRLGFLRPGEGLTELSPPSITQNVAVNPRINSSDIVFTTKNNPTDTVTIRWDKYWLNVIQSTKRTLPIGFYQRTSEAKPNSEKLSIMLSDQDRLLTFQQLDGTAYTFQRKLIEDPPSGNYRLKGWLQIISGTLILGTGYVGYQSLQKKYNDYSVRINALNAEYAVWQTLSQQPSGSAFTSMTFNSYSQPGIYAVYGSGLIGSGLIINGIRCLIKAGKG
ncbi:hypothetical protein GCM10028807_23540 [Spirosoma daeguense]